MTTLSRLHLFLPSICICEIWTDHEYGWMLVCKQWNTMLLYSVVPVCVWLRLWELWSMSVLAESQARSIWQQKTHLLLQWSFQTPCSVSLINTHLFSSATDVPLPRRQRRSQEFISHRGWGNKTRRLLFKAQYNIPPRSTSVLVTLTRVQMKIFFFSDGSTKNKIRSMPCVLSHLVASISLSLEC